MRAVSGRTLSLTVGKNVPFSGFHRYLNQERRSSSSFNLTNQFNPTGTWMTDHDAYDF
jgi:hypothetical protein